MIANLDVRHDSRDAAAGNRGRFLSTPPSLGQAAWQAMLRTYITPLTTT